MVDTRPRVVASLTTIPGRYPKLLRTLRTLTAQDHPLDAIYLGVPQESRRLKQPYPQLPAEILDIVTVVACEHDYGPATKIVGGLLAETDPNTVIITFDDDVMYSPSLVRKLLQYHQRFPVSAIGSSGIVLKYGFPFYSTISNCPGNWNSVTGFTLPEQGRPVDALCGFSSVLYVRKFFPAAEHLHEKFLRYPLLNNDVYFNDDIMISAYLSGVHVERRLVPNIPVTNENKVFDPELDQLDGNEISFDKLAFLQRFRRAVQQAHQWGFFATTEDVPLDETIGGRVTMVVIFVLLFILAIIVCLMMP
jgi:hypothetical protein